MVFFTFFSERFFTQENCLQTLLTFSSLPHPSLLAKAFHSSSEMLLRFQKSPGEYPAVVAVVMGISAPPVPQGLLWAGASGTGF